MVLSALTMTININSGSNRIIFVLSGEPQEWFCYWIGSENMFIGQMNMSKVNVTQ